MPDAGAEWVACVRSGVGLRSFDIRATPDPRTLAVLAGGAVHLLDVGGSWRTLDLLATQLTEVPAAGMLVVASFAELYGVGLRTADGPLDLLWTTPRIGLDDLEVLAVDGARVVGHVHTLETIGGERREPFVVDAATGRVDEVPRPPRGLFGRRRKEHT